MNSSRRPGAIPALPSSPDEVHLDQDREPGRASSRAALELAQRRVRGDRVDHADVREDRAHLAALQLADEMPLEQLAVRRPLLLQVLCAVLSHELHAGARRGPACPRGRRTWWPRGSAPAPLRPGGRGAPSSSQRDALQVGADTSPPAAPGSAQPCDPALPARGRLFAPVGEEALVADRARRDVRDLVHARRGEPRVRDRLAGPAWPRSGARPSAAMTSGPDLVAAGPGAGSDDGADRPVAEGAQHARRPPRGRPPPARASPRGSSPPRPRTPSATGTQSAASTATPTPGSVRGVAVGVDVERRTPSPSLVREPCGRACRGPAGSRTARAARARAPAPGAAPGRARASSPAAVDRLPAARVVKVTRPPPGSGALIAGSSSSTLLTRPPRGRPRSRPPCRPAAPRRAGARARRASRRPISGPLGMPAAIRSCAVDRQAHLAQLSEPAPSGLRCAGDALGARERDLPRAHAPAGHASAATALRAAAMLDGQRRAPRQPRRSPCRVRRRRTRGASSRSAIRGAGVGLLARSARSGMRAAGCRPCRRPAAGQGRAARAVRPAPGAASIPRSAPSCARRLK